MSQHEKRYAGAINQSLRPLDGLSHQIPVRFRKELSDEIEAAILKGRSVLLVGEQGAGKTALIAALDEGLRDRTSRTIRSLNANQIQAGCVWVGEWQSKLSVILKDAARSRTVLHLLDIWNFLHAGSSANDKSAFWDMIKPELQRRGGVQVIGEVTPSVFDELSAVPGFMTDFAVIKAPALSPEQVFDILQGYAEFKGIELSAPVLHKLMRLADTFRPQTKGLQSSLELIDELEEFLIEKEADPHRYGAVPTVSDIEATVVRSTGLPEFIVSSASKTRASEIKRWFRERIIGQEQAVDSVIQTITLYKAGMQDPRKPIGAFLFVGPSGVGKTEVAKTLAEFLFGSAKSMLRFDLSEFATYNSFEMLIGSADDPKKKARLLDPVRSNPFQVILFDEIEKAHPNVLDIMLQLLDEGRVSPPNGPPVDFRQTIVIATTNAGAKSAGKAVPGFGNPVDPVFDRDRAMREMEAFFRPELLNRFQNIIPFHPLTSDQALMVADIELKRILKREGLVNRDIAVEVERDILKHVAKSGYDVRYGGRALQRAVQKQIVLPIALTLMERSPPAGSILRVYLRDGEVAVGLTRAKEENLQAEKAKPVRKAGGEKIRITDLPAKIADLKTQIEDLRVAANINKFHGTILEVDKERRRDGFWNDAHYASSRFALQSRYQDYVDSFHRLRDDLHALETAAKAVQTKSELDRWVLDLTRLENRYARTRRHLVLIGEAMDGPALVQITPISPVADSVRILHDIYAGWSASQNFDLEMLCEPIRTGEPLLMRIDGPFAYGYLRLENGLHRIRQTDDLSAVYRVNVMMWHGEDEGSSSRDATIESRVVEGVSLLGTKLRSRVEFSAEGVLLQNTKSIFENNALVPALRASLYGQGAAVNDVVRRYDLDELLPEGRGLKKSHQKEAISPQLFHDLLCQRIDAETVGRAVERKP